MTEWSFWSFPRQTIHYHSNPSLCPNHKCQRSSGWTVLRRPTRSSRTNTQKRCPFHHRGLECKSRKSRDSWSNRQVGLGVKTEAGQRLTVLPREGTCHSKHPLPTTQEKTLHMVITRWSKPKSSWLYSLQPKMEKLYRVSKKNDGELTRLRSWALYCKIQT